MMNMISLFQDTRAVRDFTDEPVPRHIIMSILDDAVWAPNHRFREPWRFIYAEGDGKQKLAAGIDWKQHPRLVNTIDQAPLCLIVTAKMNKDEHMATEDFAAVCCLIQNIQLLSWAHGLGMTWDLGDFRGWTEFMKLAGIEENERIAGILSIGFFAPIPEKAALIELNDKVEVW